MRRLWKKCIIYMCVTLIVLSLIMQQKELLCIILLAGLYEITHTYIKSKKAIGILLFSLIVYSILSLCFCLFIFSIDNISILTVYMLVIVFDANSQLTGMLLGKHRILPIISPNKTLEGLIGGIISTLFLIGLMDSFSYKTMILAFIISIAAFGGDALASLYKRKIDIKDFNNLIPEHGGILDRFDSFIAAGAIYFLIFSL